MVSVGASMVADWFDAGSGQQKCHGKFGGGLADGGAPSPPVGGQAAGGVDRPDPAELAELAELADCANRYGATGQCH